MTLILLAGGFGTRFGGPKQFFPLGPNGECLLHYAIYDALKAGFHRFVILTRREIEDVAREAVGAHMSDRVQPVFAFQESLGGKPLGTAHAVLSCERSVVGCFGVVNGDDFYGRSSYAVLAELTKGLHGKDKACTVPYQLKRVLTSSGGVSRAHVESVFGHVKRIVEHHNIRQLENGRIVGDSPTGQVWFKPDDHVSMNMFGFCDQVWHDLHEYVAGERAAHPGQEVLLPSFLNWGISGKRLSVRYKIAESEWFGMTFPEDVDRVKARLADLHRDGVYPARL